jgi:cell division protein FtsQ
MDVFLKRQDVRKRRQWGKKLRQFERILLSMLVIVAGLAAMYGFYRLVFMGPAFAVKKVVVEGDWRMLSAEKVAALSGVKAGDNLFAISVSDVHKRLGSEPWIEEIAVRRRLPDTLCIYVREYVPVALIAGSDFYYVDGNGVIIKKPDPGEGKDLPVFSGISVAIDGTVSGENAKRLQVMLGIRDLFDKSRFGRREGLSEVNVDEVKGYSVVTREHPMQILIGESDFEERIRQVDRMINAVTAGRSPIRYMVANEKGRVIVRYRAS